jgi:hypothetical protein
MLWHTPAFTFVLMMGVVNLFGDVTYEGQLNRRSDYGACWQLASRRHLRAG